MNRVSIIISVYNAEKTLGYCLDSILNNTYKDYEKDFGWRSLAHLFEILKLHGLNKVLFEEEKVT